MFKTRIHPEQMEDEVWLGNFTLRGFRESGRKTKRRGVFAYDIDGHPLNFRMFGIDFFPVFVKRQELIDDGYDPDNPLKLTPKLRERFWRMISNSKPRGLRQKTQFMGFMFMDFEYPQLMRRY
jgi:hypothetical protein